MGIDDLLPEDTDTTASSSRSKNTQSTEKEYVKEFHSDAGVKKFTEAKWEEVKNVVRSEYPFTVNELVSMEAEKRHEVVHEIAIQASSEYHPPDTDHTSETRCIVCNTDCSDEYVVIEDEQVHVMHNVMQVADALDKEVQSE